MRAWMVDLPAVQLEWNPRIGPWRCPPAGPPRAALVRGGAPAPAPSTRRRRGPPRAGGGGGAGRGGMTLLTAGYRTFFRSNLAYLTLICGGALVGERAVHYGGNALWESNNKGKLYKDLEGTVIGGERDEDED